MNPADMNYPIPDPIWDYASIWHDLQAAKAQLEKLLTEMASIEEATQENDRSIQQLLSSIYPHLDRAMSRFPYQDNEAN